jgi:indole-3-glycerol phosphate synthase
MPTTLERILASTRETLPALRARHSELESAAARSPVPQPLFARWAPSRVGLIAEVKRRSPSAGTIRADLDPVEHAIRYAGAGACAISVLTDGPWFGGSLEDLREVAGAVPVPVLRKDFILDEVQLAQARAAGASAVLLIVRALTPARLAELLRAAAGYRLDVLVEAHDAPELEIALTAGARYLGINSRNLDDFRIDTEAAWALLQRIPSDRMAVAESGMATEADVRRAAAAGADAVLIGTALSGAADPSALVAAVSSVERGGR